MAGRDSPQSGPEDANAPGGSLPGGKPAGRSRKRTPTAWFGTLSQLDFDIDFFERLLARKADSVEVLRILAELVSKRGLVNRAVALDRRLVELGLNEIFHIARNPLPWLDDMLNAVEHANFFENRSTEYSKASTTGSWEEAFADHVFETPQPDGAILPAE